MRLTLALNVKFWSLPVRGAWIEMIKHRIVRFVAVRRSPCGERGLKYQWGAVRRTRGVSLPVRGAWIEIIISERTARRAKSLPVRGAWIEIASIIIGFITN